MQEILSNNTHRKTILITGATSGIGKALSKIYLKNDWTVIGIGRDKTKIEEFSLDFPNNFYFYQVDLNNFEKTNIIFDEIFSKFKNINSFILNAGIYIPEDFQSFKFINAQETFNVNVLSIYLILDKIKSFFELTHAHTIAIISSVAGYRGLPAAGAYCASKSALISFAESLYFDMIRKNVKVSVISPGFIKTPMTDQNDFPMPMIKSAEYAADKIYLGLLKKSGFEIHFPKAFTFLMKIIQILPNWLYFGAINFGNRFMKRD